MVDWVAGIPRVLIFTAVSIELHIGRTIFWGDTSECILLPPMTSLEGHDVALNCTTIIL